MKVDHAYLACSHHTYMIAGVLAAHKMKKNKKCSEGTLFKDNSSKFLLIRIKLIFSAFNRLGSWWSFKLCSSLCQVGLIYFQSSSK